MFLMYGGVDGVQTIEADVCTDGKCHEDGFKLDDPKRQHLHIYHNAGASKPTPFYIFAHGNGGKAAMLTTAGKIIDDVAREGYSTVSWESVQRIQTTADLQTCQSDLALVMGWLNENAGLYNLDVNNIIMGGRSRGSMCSWMSAHSGDPGIKGIYMHSALPNEQTATFIDAVTANSPPAYLPYNTECPKPIKQDCRSCRFPETGPTCKEDIHNPRYGQQVVERYIELGIGDNITLTDGMSKAGFRPMYYFSDFVQILSGSFE